MSKGCDHSTAYVNGSPVHIGAALKTNGYVGVFRYAATGRGDVNISRSEADDLKAHGIGIGIVNEHSAAYLLGGYNTGHDRALGARDVCRAAGLEDGVIYMGGDSEVLQANSSNLRAVGAAMRGAGDALASEGGHREWAGYYGSYYVIDYLVHNEPWIQYYWQTVAWSSGHVHPRANALQHASVAYVGGVELDLDDLLKDDWGQRGHQPPTPPEEEVDMATEVAVHNADGRVELLSINIDGKFSHKWIQQDGTWSDWEVLGAPVKLKEITAAKHNDGHLEAFCKGTDNFHYHTWQEGPNGGWVRPLQRL
jgi:Rv2525c-like, glycoside hydrolase-like domain